MTLTDTASLREVALPFSDGLMTAKLWKVRDRYATGVPELGLHCYGESETEAVFRLFTSLLRYYRQLKANEAKLNERGLQHLEYLKHWVSEIEKRMTTRTSPTAPSFIMRRQSRFTRRR